MPTGPIFPIEIIPLIIGSDKSNFNGSLSFAIPSHPLHTPKPPNRSSKKGNGSACVHLQRTRTKPEITGGGHKPPVILINADKIMPAEFTGGLALLRFPVNSLPLTDRAFVFSPARIGHSSSIMGKINGKIIHPFGIHSTLNHFSS